MSTKSKSNLSETSNHKLSSAIPRVSKVSRGVAKSNDSSSPLQNLRHSVDRSPRSVTSKPVVDRRSPKLSTLPEKQSPRVSKGSELQAQLNTVQEEFKKAREKVVLVEKEKAQSIDELREAQRLAEDANEKLREALVAQKRAEENTEIEKFRAVEMEQVGIDAAKNKEEEWQRELEAVRNQHALDVNALLSANQDLQRMKQEFAMACDAKQHALSQANDATKTAEIHAEKVEILSAELVQLKALLDSKLETETNENIVISELKVEIETLKQELEKAKSFEEKLLNKEALLEQLSVELEVAKMAESDANNLVEDWKRKVKQLEVQVDEARVLERSASESLESVMKQLEGSNDSLHDAESEIASLKEKVGLLEISIGRQKGEVEEAEHCLGMARDEVSEMEKKVESLESELETVKEEKIEAINNEKLAAASVQTLLEEKNKIINELETSREEEEKSKKAMESLASALHEVSSESRVAKEKLLSNQAGNEHYVTQIEDLNLVLKATKEKYESMLDDAKHEIDILTNSIEQYKHEHQTLKIKWEEKELHLINSIKKSETESFSMDKEINRLTHLLQEAEEEAFATNEEEVKVKNNLKEAESEVICLREVVGEAKSENNRLLENLLGKENELQSVIQENDELQSREAAARSKVEELSKLLEEAMSRKQGEENGELTDSEKDYDMLPKVVEFSEQNGYGKEEKHKLELQFQKCDQAVKQSPQNKNDNLDEAMVQMGAKLENLKGKSEDNYNKEKEDDDSAEVEFKMWESCKIEEKDFSPEKESGQESLEELDSKTEGGEGYDHINGHPANENLDNGGSSPLKQQNQKKKKPLLRKFGNLLKKKGTSNQK